MVADLSKAAKNIWFRDKAAHRMRVAFDVQKKRRLTRDGLVVQQVVLPLWQEKKDGRRPPFLGAGRLRVLLDYSCAK